MSATDAGTGILDDTYTAQGLTTTSGSGANATADIEVSGGSVVSITPVDAGAGYQVGDTVSASLPAATVVTPGTGEIISISFAGGDGLDAADSTLSAVAPSSTTSAAGNSATFDITIESGAVTDVQLAAFGSDYEASDEITISVADLGSSTGNDLVISIDSVDEDSTSVGPSITITAAVDTIN